MNSDMEIKYTLVSVYDLIYPVLTEKKKKSGSNSGVSDLMKRFPKLAVDSEKQVVLKFDRILCLSFYKPILVLDVPHNKHPLE